jgi:hypothetical protein
VVITFARGLLRLSHADHVPDALIIQIKQFKAKIIQYLQQCAVSDLIEEIAQHGTTGGRTVTPTPR